MAENKQTFILVGEFKDGITPSLRKLSTQLNAVTKSFDKFSRTLRPISKELGIMAMASERLAQSQKGNRSVYEGNIRALREYKRVIGEVGRAQTSLSRNTPKSLTPPRQPGAPRGGGGGGGGGGMGSAAAMVAGERAGDKGVGFWGMTGAMMLANMGVQAATGAFHKLTSSLNGFVQGGSQAEQSIIQMSGTLFTLGKVGSYEKAQKLADSMMGDLGKVAAALPGSTEDYLSILQQTLDDQIQAFGSVEAVQKNLAGFDYKTGEKLAGGAEQSFTALLGMSAQLAGMRPELAAMDLMQLKQNPENIRQVQLLTRNPTLQAYYKEELKKSGGDFIKALDAAMKKAIPKEQIEALKNSFDSAYQSFVTTFTDKYGGIFGPMRKVKVKVRDAMGNFVEETTNAMASIGRIMRSINEVTSSVWSLIQGTGLDPMVMLVTALEEIDYQIYKYANLIMIMVNKIKAGEAGWGDLIYQISYVIGEAIAKFGNWLMNLDYEQFFKDLDTLIYNFFKGLFDGFLANYTGVDMGNKGPLGGLGSSVSGTVITLAGLILAGKTLIGVIGTISTVVTGAGAVIAGWAGVVTPVVTVLSGAMSVLATAVTTVVLPFLAVAAAVLGTIAILRHGDFILSTFWEGLKLAGNAVMWFIHTLQEAQARLWAGVFSLLSKIPGIGGMFKGMATQAEKEAADFQRKKLDREKAMAANTAKIADNTAKSWERTKGDFKTIGDAFSGLADKAKKTSSSFENNKMFEEDGKKFGWAVKNNEKVIVEWGSVAGTALKGVADAAGSANAALKAVKPAGTPTMDNRNYTVGGVTYDWKTGAPVKPGTPSSPPAGGGAGGQRGSGARPTAPIPAAAPNLAPVTTAVTGTTTAVNTVGANVRTASTALQNVTTATQATQLATQGITPGLTALHTAFQTFVALFTTTSTEQATRDTKTQALLNSIIIGNNSIRSALMVISNKVSPLAKIESNTSETNVLLKTINTSIKGISLMGGMPGGFSPPLGGAQGSLKQAASMASAKGLQVTSSFRPGDPGYHGVGRAMDFSNSTGPTPQMMEFAQQMIAQYGSSLTELIYSPLGFSIKNGKKVAPLAYGAHFNHVHVAFARGLENPRLFTTAQAAMAYESMAMPAGAKVQTITANSSENLGGHYTVNQNISISGAQDPRKLAEMVFNYAAQAAEHVNNSSFA